ncbi:PREDICTED: arrestin domain-containing protein 5 [Charadrius vociferus]|uniref:arrestin domain-containing protein 5 n=1 Tax=Charadrius vociferus TaxID=50402 RepID=UPI00052165AD|nr:PREDICTED: arrestin domain-containing protein 5 [Charadrius vociferus]
MSTVRAINLVLPETEVYLAGSSIDGQLVLNLRSTLVDPVVKVELVGRGCLKWLEEDNPEQDYEKSTAFTNQAVYVSKAQNFHIEDGWLDSGVHTFDFHFNLPTSIPSTFTSQIGCISYFVQGTCCSHQVVLAKEQRCLLLQGTAGGYRKHVKDTVPLVVEARKDVVYFCCFRHGSVILRISLEKNIFCPGDTIVFKTDIANRTCKYVRKVIFALHCIVLYSGFSSRGERRSLEDRREVTRLESRTDTAPFEATRVTSALVLPKPMPVTSTLTENKIMAFRYELVGTSGLPCTTSTIVGRVPIIIAVTPKHFSVEQNTMTLHENEGDIAKGVSLHRDISEIDPGAIASRSTE